VPSEEERELRLRPRKPQLPTSRDKNATWAQALQRVMRYAPNDPEGSAPVAKGDLSRSREMRCEGNGRSRSVPCSFANGGN
jgi:hypothetical protein